MVFVLDLALSFIHSSFKFHEVSNWCLWVGNAAFVLLYQRQNPGRSLLCIQLVVPLWLTHHFNEHILNWHIQVVSDILQPSQTVFSHHSTSLANKEINTNVCSLLLLCLKYWSLWPDKKILIYRVRTKLSVLLECWSTVCNLKKTRVYVLLSVSLRGLIPQTLHACLSKTISSNTSHCSFNFCTVRTVFVFHMLQKQAAYFRE